MCGSAVLLPLVAVAFRKKLVYQCLYCLNVNVTSLPDFRVGWNLLDCARPLLRRGMVYRPRFESNPLNIKQVPRRDIVRGDVPSPRAASKRHRWLEVSCKPYSAVR